VSVFEYVPVCSGSLAFTSCLDATSTTSSKSGRANLLSDTCSGYRERERAVGQVPRLGHGQRRVAGGGIYGGGHRRRALLLDAWRERAERRGRAQRQREGHATALPVPAPTSVSRSKTLYTAVAALEILRPPSSVCAFGASTWNAPDAKVSLLDDCGRIVLVGLLDEEQLERSAVVANNAMNRLRGLSGVNSYARELGFDPLAVLRPAIQQRGKAAWLDLCCGSGRALSEAARDRSASLDLVGIDLVDFFDAHDESVTLIAGPLRLWRPDRTFDLITCVHGLHYVGDKLAALTQTLRWLSAGGRFCGHLDLNNLKRRDRSSLAPTIRGCLREAEIDYDARRRLITCAGPRDLEFGLRYLGGDDRAGAGFSGQPAVDSYYEIGTHTPPSDRRSQASSVGDGRDSKSSR
jgi:SAM-dependent methyltransferase